MPRETEEEMTERVAKMQGADVDKDNKDNKDDKEVEGVQLELEQAGANTMPHIQQETGLKSEKDDDEKGKEKDNDDNTGDTNEDPDKVVTQGSQDDILTVSNAKKRIHDAQTKMHTVTSEKAETEALLEAANQKVKSYESIISKSGVDSAEGIKAQQNIDDTNIQTIADLQALEKEYPEISKPIISAFDKMQKQLDSMKKEQSASVESINESNEKMLTDMHFKRIGEFHPDFAIIDKSTELANWIDNLPPFRRSAALATRKDGNADESISMLDEFKEDTGYGSNNGSGNNNDNTDDKTKDAANLDLAKSKVSPTFNKKTNLKLKDNTKQLTVAEMRKLPPTKESEDRILLAMASGNLIP